MKQKNKNNGQNGETDENGNVKCSSPIVAYYLNWVRNLIGMADRGEVCPVDTEIVRGECEKLLLALEMHLPKPE